MKYDARDMATMIVRACRGLSDKDTRAAIARFVAAAEKKLGAAAVRDIAAAVPAAWKKEEGIGDVTVRSARPLTDADIAKLLAAIGADPKRTEVRREIDPELLGGAVVQSHDKILDMSLKSRVGRLRKSA